MSTNQSGIKLPAVFYRSLVQAAAAHSLPIGDVLSSLHYDFPTLPDQSTVDLTTLFHLADALVAVAPFDTLLPFVKIISYEQIDELMTLMVTGKTMRSGLENITSIVGAKWTPGFTAQYHSTQNHDYLRCEDHSNQLNQHQLQFAMELAFGTFLRVASLLTGLDNIVKAVHFTSEPVHILEYEAVFQCPVLFNQPFNQLVLPAGVSDQPLASYCPPIESDAVNTLKKKVADTVISDTITCTIISEVIQALHQQPETTSLTVNAVAKSLGLSVRSLQRKLKESGKTFSALRVEFLIEQSKTLLAQPELTMDAIAEQLTFSDRAAFSRAFKRIVGLSPSLYRKQKYP